MYTCFAPCMYSVTAMPKQSIIGNENINRPKN